MERKLIILLELAKAGNNLEKCEISSNELAEKIDCSQQTAARWLNKLSEKNYINKNAGARGQIIELTSKSIDWLRSVQQEIRDVFEETQLEKFVLRGELVSGFNEGSYYIGQENYQQQFEEKLGFRAFPGTLDIKLDERSLRLKERLQNLRGKEIEGFSTEERSFGGAKGFPAKIKGVEAAVILPYRTHHEENILEIISPEKLRDKFGLEDGDEVEVEVEI